MPALLPFVCFRSCPRCRVAFLVLFWIYRLPLLNVSVFFAYVG